jgi:hypothetical protein
MIEHRKLLLCAAIGRGGGWGGLKRSKGWPHGERRGSQLRKLEAKGVRQGEAAWVILNFNEGKCEQASKQEGEWKRVHRIAF